MICLNKQTHTIKQTAIIPAAPKEIYEAFTYPKIYSEFTGDKFIGFGKVGEKFTVYDIIRKLLELEKGKRIVEMGKLKLAQRICTFKS